MSYYPAWLDYAAWSLAIAGGCCFFLMLSEPVGRRRGLLKAGGCMLLACGVALGAIGGILFNLRAPRPTAEGTIYAVTLHRGKNSSTTFSLRTPGGDIANLSLSGTHGELLDGETARVTYQEGSHTALHLQVLQGTYSGFEHTESDGSVPSWMALVFAIGLAAYGLVDWLNDGTASSPEVESQSLPDGEVDPQSMLHISND